jgi:hypothetical protein
MQRQHSKTFARFAAKGGQVLSGAGQNNKDPSGQGRLPYPSAPLLGSWRHPFGAGRFCLPDVVENPLWAFWPSCGFLLAGNQNHSGQMTSYQ